MGSVRELFSVPLQLLGGERLTVSTQGGQVDDSLNLLLVNGKQLEDQQFTFRLTDGQGAVVGEKKNDGTGDITFDTIDFDQDDIGKTYTYTITELDDAKQGYTYDAHTETVKVKVEDAGGGKLNVVAEYDADGAQFENNYAPNVGFAVLKHDENDQPLGGAKFTLYLDDGDNKFTSMDSPATI